MNFVSTSRMCAMLFIGLLTSCEVSQPGIDSGVRAYGYSGYSATKYLTTKTKVVGTAPLNDSDKTNLEKSGFDKIKTLTLFPDGKMDWLISSQSESGLPRDTTVHFHYEISGDVLTVLGDSTLCGDPGCKLGYKSDEVRFKGCNYFNAYKDLGICILPPPDIWQLSSVFANRDTIWATEADFIFKRK
jgi:hypothetical protein